VSAGVQTFTFEGERRFKCKLLHCYILNVSYSYWLFLLKFVYAVEEV
jgi:hypothetical protein